MPDVDQPFDGLDLSVAVFDCCVWWRVAVVMRGGHSVYCTFRHGRHLGTGVDNCIDIVLLPNGGLHCMLLLADAFGKGSCRAGPISLLASCRWTWLSEWLI